MFDIIAVTPCAVRADFGISHYTSLWAPAAGTGGLVSVMPRAFKVPSQALYMMNSPFVMEQARQAAQRLIRVVVLRAQHDFERPAAAQETCEVLHAAGARVHTRPRLRLRENR
jgi:hypothetical protein